MTPLVRPYNLLPTHPLRPERLDVIHELTQAAFAPYADLARPSGALRETPGDVAADVEAGGAMMAYDGDWSRPLGAVRWRLEPDHLWVKRVAVHPDHQGQGVGDFLMDACRGVALGHGRTRLRLGVRNSLDRNRRWYERRGFRPVVHHDDWAEHEVELIPFTYRDRAELTKYEFPDHEQGRNVVDVLEETDEGWWLGTPAFTPSFQQGRIVWVAPRPVVSWAPRAAWWLASFSTGHLPLKVDICTPAERRPNGDVVFRDLSLDVVVERGDGAQIVDEDEFAAAAYPEDIADHARGAVDEVLRLVTGGVEPFGGEGVQRLAEYDGA